MRALLVGLCLAAIAPPPPGHWAKDTSGKIGADTLRQLDQIAEGVNATGDGQLGVLVVRTTSGQNPNAFATGVFNAWGIGHREYKNGILLFVALDDRKAEIILGDGLKNISTGDTDAIMREHVVSNFKAGKPEQGLLDGARALAALLTSKPAVAHAPQVMSTEDAFAETKVSELFASGQIADPSPRHWLIDLTGTAPTWTVNTLERQSNDLYASDARPLFVVLFRSSTFDAAAVAGRAHASLSVKHPRAAVLAVNAGRQDAAFRLPDELHADSRAAAIEDHVAQIARQAVGLDNLAHATIVAGTALIDGIPKRTPSEVVGEAVDRHGTAFAGFGGVMLLGAAFWGRRWNRYRSRSCDDCQRPRQLLPAGAEDKHLNDGQQTEQSIGSVDYDVWWCGVCRSVLVRDYSAWFSGHSSCKKCNNRTLKSTSTTLEHATEYSGGRVRVDEKCAHCSYTNSYTRTTARLTKTRSSSSSFSSSSSSRSSFGGGSSSGRGSSGSW